MRELSSGSAVEMNRGGGSARGSNGRRGPSTHGNGDGASNSGDMPVPVYGRGAGTIRNKSSSNNHCRGVGVAAVWAIISAALVLGVEHVVCRFILIFFTPAVTKTKLPFPLIHSR